MESLILQFIFCVLAIHASWGMAAGLVLQDAIQRADLIVHIRVDDDLEISPRFQHTRNPDGSFTMMFPGNPEDPHAYTRRATASVVHAFQGDAGGRPIKIRHSNGFTCPNVSYHKGEEYIAFLQKEPDSDHYVTMNYYAGQFKVEEGEVIAFYLMEGYKYPDDLRLPYSRVATFLKESVEKQKN